jgi:hypothetical protein
MYRVVSLFTLFVALAMNTAFGQVASVCAVPDGTRSCATLYGPWPGHVSNGCNGVAACANFNGTMECNGWSARVDKITGRTAITWNDAYQKVRLANAGEPGHHTDTPVNHECFVMYSCETNCEFQDNTQSWTCKANFNAPIPYNVVEDRLKNVACTGDAEA